MRDKTINDLATNNLDLAPIADSDEFGDAVPVIDIGAVTRDASSVEARAAVDEIATACRDWGFFQVVDHGISADLISRMVQSADDFFSRPIDVKESILRTRENPWGYYNNELTKNQRDKKEVFDFTTDGIDPIYESENRWPEIGSEFQDNLRAYLAACEKLSLTLLEAFCVGLDLPPDFMHADFAGRHTGFVRLNHYPVSDPLAESNVDHQPKADLGVHHHTDAGALTTLLQDSVGGLQVYRAGYWHNIPPVEGAFVVNTGDMMQVWSNDTYQAAVHRVLAMDTRDRYSFPFFFNPAAEAIVEPLPTTVGKDRPARYAQIGWSDFRGKRTDGDYADYGPEVQISQFRI